MAKPLEAELRAWLIRVEAVLHGDAAVARVAMAELPPLLRDLSLDGAYRLVESFGLLVAPGDPVRAVRLSSAGLTEVGAMVVRGLRRLSCVGRADDVEKLPFDAAHLPVLIELADAPASDADGQRAAWLLDVYRSARTTGVHRVGAPPRCQLPLFL